MGEGRTCIEWVIHEFKIDDLRRKSVEPKKKKLEKKCIGMTLTPICHHLGDTISFMEPNWNCTGQFIKACSQYNGGACLMWKNQCIMISLLRR